MHDSEDLAGLVGRVQRDYDVILVEGHKTTPLPRKLWLRRHARDRAPRACLPVHLDLRRDQDRITATWEWIERELAHIHHAAPTMAGILIGGASQRMGRSKHLLTYRGRTWLARIVAAARQVADGVVLLGGGQVPRSCAALACLPDAPGLAGPLAGMCAALRWRPDARWIFLACDSPLVTSDALHWLKDQARPGIWAVQPRLSASERPDPLPGWYDFRAAAALESARGPSWLARHPRSATPVLPGQFATAWLNCNTPADARRLAEAVRRHDDDRQDEQQRVLLGKTNGGQDRQVAHQPPQREVVAEREQVSETRHRNPRHQGAKAMQPRREGQQGYGQSWVQVSVGVQVNPSWMRAAQIPLAGRPKS